MNQDNLSSPPPEVIRLSLRWVMAALILIVIIGAIGGIIGTSFVRPPRPALTQDEVPLIANVQEITISPSKAAAALVSDSERAVLLLVEGAAAASRPAAVGLVVTNDGLVVSTTNLSASTLFAFDATGARLPLSKVGADALYGLNYYRLNSAVIPPFGMSGQDPAVGTSLLALGRTADT